ncbi:hypothetical protein ACFUYE_00170 [Micromonospora humida]|uniref:hypothetical protein n=1 Tax=Micromonospora humida TaxID=2809018 RepID=UPI00366B80C3
MNDDVTAAASLVAFGLRPKLLPARDPAYRSLVIRHRDDDAFAVIVTAVAEGLGLRVLDVDAESGIVLSALHGSVFELRLDQYARQTRTSDRRDVEKVLHGVTFLAAAALAFPRPADLANDQYTGRVSVAEVDTMAREVARDLRERADATDPEADAPRLEQVWRAYARRPESQATKDGRVAPDSTRGMVARALRYLADQGLLVPIPGDIDGLYRTTRRFLIQVRELAVERTMDELLKIGVVPVLKPGGSLRAASGGAEGQG